MSLSDLNPEKLRGDFPVFECAPGVIHFDNAATTQKPKQVIEAVMRTLSHECANPGRGAYAWSGRAAASYEDARRRVAKFINASDPGEVVFTSGGTASLNSVALAWGAINLKDGDEIILCPYDHSSSVRPWFNLQRMLKARGVGVRIVPIRIDPQGFYLFDDIQTALTSHTRLAALTQVHNVFGLEMELGEIRAILPPQVLLSVDACQSVGHMPVDVQALGADFLSFSGHKVFAAPGIGVLWVRKDLHSELIPCLTGGGQPAEYRGASASQILEAGTPNLPGAVSLAAALDFVERIGLAPIEGYLRELTDYAVAALRRVPGIQFMPGPAYCRCSAGHGIVSFRLPPHDPKDIGLWLEQHGIHVRAGGHCLADDTYDECVRVSLQIYNTTCEVDQLVDALLAIEAVDLA